jgi:hypothetical protein
VEIKVEVKLVKDGVKAEVRVEVEVDTQAEVKQVSRLIFELRKYRLNYLFKYSKSMVESNSIVIMVPT